MARLSKLFLITTVLVVSGFYSYQSAFGWKTISQTSELFVVGGQAVGAAGQASTAGQTAGAEHSYLYTVHPVTGEVAMIGDTGLNNCTGIDFDSAGKLKALCEIRDEEILSTKGGLVAGGAVIAELDTETGAAKWAVPHGVSNNISDIAIREDGVLFSYENLDIDSLHRHEEVNDFQAMFIGSPDIAAEYHAMAAWGTMDLKVAANVQGVPAMYSVDPATADEAFITNLAFPNLNQVVNAENATRDIVLEDVEFLAMDTLAFAGSFGEIAASTKVAGTYAFAETDAEFAALLFRAGVDVQAEVSKNALNTDWAAIALIDMDTGVVDYIVELQNEEGLEFRGLALRQRPPAQVPTLSEWGLIATAVLLFAGALIFLRRRGLSMQS